MTKNGLKWVTVLFVIFLLYGFFAKQAALKDTTFPYGKWESASGYFFEVFKNDSYRVCYFETCNEGRLSWEPSWEGDKNPDMIGFYKQPVVRQMYMDMKLITHTIPGTVHYEIHEKGDFNLYPTVPPGKLKRKMCRGRPCIGFGATNDNDYYFVLK